MSMSPTKFECAFRSLMGWRVCFRNRKYHRFKGCSSSFNSAFLLFGFIVAQNFLIISEARDGNSLRLIDALLRERESAMGKQGTKDYDPSNVGRRMSGEDYGLSSKMLWLHGLKSHDFHVLRNESMKFSTCKGSFVGKKHLWLRKDVKSIVFVFGLLSFLLLLDSFMVSFFDSIIFQNSSPLEKSPRLKEVGRDAYIMKEKPPVQMYDRLLKLASSALAKKEFKQVSPNLWKEPNKRQVAAWKPCADRKVSKSIGRTEKTNGYIIVSANGGLNQQRVAICNAVAVASFLNATLVVPRVLYSNVWNDPSQFGDIYQEEYFIDTMEDEVNIVKELPSHLASLDLEAIGSLITDADLVKEAKPSDYVRNVLPILLQNGVVHLLGYGNQLGFDPLPPELQRLRCKCNFHALKFAPEIQRVGSLLVRRIRKYDSSLSMLDKQLLGNFMHSIHLKQQDHAVRVSSKYLALHLRFEIDMVAYSLCDFGGGESEKNELKAYREIHFPLLIERLKTSKSVSQSELRKLGKCPLTPEEAALVLAAIGFKHGTYIFLAGYQIYGGNSRMSTFTNLYPNLVTKESLLAQRELAPFRNFSSKLASLDFIACATADVFAMTDSGSQLSSLVSGFRTYYGGGHAPTLQPNKKRLAAILSENSTIDWNSFDDRVKRMIEEGQRVHMRRFGRSIYRQPRCPQCMRKSYL